MIKLRLMQKDDVDDASKIIIKAHDYYYELESPYQENVRIKNIIPMMHDSLETGCVYVLGYKDGALVAAYQLPFFEREKDKPYDVITKSDDHFATEPTGKGIGHEFFERLDHVFPNVAKRCDSQALYHDTISRWKSSFFEDVGYRLTSAKDLGRYVYHYYQKVYPADVPDLTPDEDRIVDEIVRRILSSDVAIASKDI